MNTMHLEQFLTRKELARARTMFHDMRGTSSQYAQRVCREIIQPNIERINATLRHDNDPLYLAYIVEYVMRTTLP